MNKETQDILWSILSKDDRYKVRNLFEKHCRSGHDETSGILEDFFGGSNILSCDWSEPEEMLFVERKKVQEYYKDVQQSIGEENGDTRIEMDGRKYAMLYFFGDKCLPDKEQQEFQERILGNPDRPTDKEIMLELAGEIENKEPIVSNHETKDDTKEPMEEKELNRKALYDALCELESASVKVRKALISL